MRRLFLHIGLHKTGTTYLQNVWRANRGALSSQQVFYPGDGRGPAQSHALWDLFGTRPPRAARVHVAGQWQELTDTVAASEEAVTLISDEYFSLATVAQARRVVRSFPDHEVDIVVTARDLARVLVSSWQEGLKTSSSWTWPEYAAAARDTRVREPGRQFWLRHDLPAILETWSTVVPQERIHVVTVPPTGSPPELLMQRVGQVVGFDPSRLPEEPVRDNESMGVPTVEVVRRLNAALRDADPKRQLNRYEHDHVVKRVLVRGLAQQGTPARFVLPAEDLDWVRPEAERVVTYVRSNRYAVVGDLTELLPAARPVGRRPDDATDAELLEVAMQALVLLAEDAGKQWWRSHRRTPVEQRDQPLTRLLSSRLRGAVFALKHEAVRLAERSRLMSAALGVYLKFRDRSRRRGLRRR